MASDQPGLRKRMQLEAKRIFHQHEQLDAFYAMAAEAMNGSDARLAREAFSHLRDALVAHFEVEERTHFPAIHGLSPATDSRLAGLVREHGEFREQLARLEEALIVSDLATATRELEALARALSAHEKVEEELFQASTGAS